MRTLWEVVLNDIDDNHEDDAFDELMRQTGLDEEEVEELLDEVPAAIWRGRSLAVAEEMVERLSEVHADVELCEVDEDELDSRDEFRFSGEYEEPVEYEIRGTTMPVVEIMLQNGQSVYCESGGMAWIRGDVEMKTNMRGTILRGLARSLAGESFALTSYTGAGDGGSVVFALKVPGTIVPVDLDETESLICQKEAFLVAEQSVDLRMFFRSRIGAGLFGGEGFIMQEISGPGLAWIEVDGEVTIIDLDDDEELLVDPGHIAMLEPSVDFDIKRVKGAMNILFGGEGLFLASLIGPGRVWLQSMTIRNFAAQLRRYMPRRSR